MTELTFRRYQEGDEESIITLCEAVYGISTNNDYWRWKYINNSSNLNASYVAVTENKVVGISGAIPYRLKIGDKEIVGGQLTDLMSHPDYRNKNIFLPIMRKSIKDVERKMDTMYGFTNENSFKIYAKRLKYDIAFRVPRLDRVINTKPFLNRMLKRKDLFTKIIGNILNLASGNLLYPKTPSLGKEIEIRECYKFDERFDVLWNKLKGFFTTITIRDSKYLNWRYRNHPLFKYRTFVAERRDEISGFIILRCAEDKGVKRGYIMDLLVEPERKESLMALFAQAMRFFKDNDVDLVRCWMFPHAPYYSLFRRSLFFKTTSDLVVLTTSFHKDISNEFLRDPSNWYITIGDCDSF